MNNLHFYQPHTKICYHIEFKKQDTEHSFSDDNIETSKPVFPCENTDVKSILIDTWGHFTMGLNIAMIALASHLNLEIWQVMPWDSNGKYIDHIYSIGIGNISLVNININEIHQHINPADDQIASQTELKESPQVEDGDLFYLEELDERDIHINSSMITGSANTLPKKQLPDKLGGICMGMFTEITVKTKRLPHIYSIAICSGMVFQVLFMSEPFLIRNLPICRKQHNCMSFTDIRNMIIDIPSFVSPMYSLNQVVKDQKVMIETLFQNTCRSTEYDKYILMRFGDGRFEFDYQMSMNDIFSITDIMECFNGISNIIHTIMWIHSPFNNRLTVSSLPHPAVYIQKIEEQMRSYISNFDNGIGAVIKVSDISNSLLCVYIMPGSIHVQQTLGYDWQQNFEDCNISFNTFIYNEIMKLLKKCRDISNLPIGLYMLFDSMINTMIETSSVYTCRASIALALKSGPEGDIIGKLLNIMQHRKDILSTRIHKGKLQKEEHVVMIPSMRITPKQVKYYYSTPNANSICESMGLNAGNMFFNIIPSKRITLSVFPLHIQCWARFTGQRDVFFMIQVLSQLMSLLKDRPEVKNFSPSDASIEALNTFDSITYNEVGKVPFSSRCQHTRQPILIQPHQLDQIPPDDFKKMCIMKTKNIQTNQIYYCICRPPYDGINVVAFNEYGTPIVCCSKRRRANSHITDSMESNIVEDTLLTIRDTKGNMPIKSIQSSHLINNTKIREPGKAYYLPDNILHHFLQKEYNYCTIGLGSIFARGHMWAMEVLHYYERRPYTEIFDEIHYYIRKCYDDILLINWHINQIIKNNNISGGFQKLDQMMVTIYHCYDGQYNPNLIALEYLKAVNDIILLLCTDRYNMIILEFADDKIWNFNPVSYNLLSLHLESNKSLNEIGKPPVVALVVRAGNGKPDVVIESITTSVPSLCFNWYKQSDTSIDFFRCIMWENLIANIKKESLSIPLYQVRDKLSKSGYSIELVFGINQIFIYGVMIRSPKSNIKGFLPIPVSYNYIYSKIRIDPPGINDVFTIDDLNTIFKILEISCFEYVIVNSNGQFIALFKERVYPFIPTDKLPKEFVHLHKVYQQISLLNKDTDLGQSLQIKCHQMYTVYKKRKMAPIWFNRCVKEVVLKYPDQELRLQILDMYNKSMFSQVLLNKIKSICEFHRINKMAHNNTIETALPNTIFGFDYIHGIKHLQNISKTERHKLVMREVKACLKIVKEYTYDDNLQKPEINEEDLNMALDSFEHLINSLLYRRYLQNINHWKDSIEFIDTTQVLLQPE